jgi:hypothetical protein
VFSVWSVQRLCSKNCKLEELTRGQGTYEDIVAAEACEQSNLEPGAQKSIRDKHYAMKAYGGVSG